MKPSLIFNTLALSSLVAAQQMMSGTRATRNYRSGVGHSAYSKSETKSSPPVCKYPEGRKSRKERKKLKK